MGHFEISYCGALVRAQDADRFLLSHFARADLRADLWALFAFNHEIAKTREVVSETRLGLIRLQWWRDVIGTIYDGGNIAEHEVVQDLARVIAVHDLERDLFEALIYAREFDLEDMLPASVEGVLHYADFTATPLLRLVMAVLDKDCADAEPLQAIASNYAVAGILRSVAHFAKVRRCLLPQDVMEAQGVFVNQLYEMKPQGSLPLVVEAVAQGFVKGVKPNHRYLRAMQKLSELYMAQLSRRGYDPFDRRMAVPPAFKELRLFLNL